MKKITALLFFCIMMTTICIFSFFGSALCENPYPVSTRKPDAFQFCELYVERLIELENTMGIDIQTIGTGSILAMKDFYKNTEGLLYADCSGGDILFNSEDYKIEKWNTLYFYLDDDKDKLTKNILKAALAVSVLEYDHIDELYMRYLDNRSPALIVYENILYPMSENLDAIIAESKESKIPVKVYEGKYDYYLQYLNSGENKGMVVISAE